jgi:hypothetical protein
MKDWVIGISLSALAVFAPIKALFLVTGILILSDLVTGILAARKRGQKISSAAMRRTITKVFVYQCAIGIGFLIETYMLDGFVPVSKIAAGLISLVEGKSIFENLDVINGHPIFKTLVEKLGSVNDLKEVLPPSDKKDGESL